MKANEPEQFGCARKRLVRSSLMFTGAAAFFGLCIFDFVAHGISALYFFRVPLFFAGSDGSNVTEVSSFFLVVGGFVTVVTGWELRHAWVAYKAAKGERAGP